MLVTLRDKGFISFLSSFLTARGRQIMINKDGCRKGGFSWSFFYFNRSFENLYNFGGFSKS